MNKYFSKEMYKIKDIDFFKISWVYRIQILSKYFIKFTLYFYFLSTYRKKEET